MFSSILLLFYKLRYGKNNVQDLEWDEETQSYIIAVASGNRDRVQKDIDNGIAFICGDKLIWTNRPYHGIS